MIPSPWVAAVLTLASYRLFRLVAWDDLPPLVRARRWATGAKAGRRGSANAMAGLSNDQVETTLTYARPKLAYFIGCPWCVGFWIGLGVYLAWVFAPTAALYAAVPLAINVAVVYLTRFDEG